MRNAEKELAEVLNFNFRIPHSNFRISDTPFTPSLVIAVQ